MQITTFSTKEASTARRGFALVEVLVAIGIMVMIYGGVIMAYIQTDRRAEWSGYSLAAQALSIRQLEQARAARWDTQGGTYVDYSTNIITTWTNILDIPYTGTNYVYATNFTTITTETNSSSSFHMYRVDTVWAWRGKLFTNTTASYRAPN